MKDSGSLSLPSPALKTLAAKTPRSLFFIWWARTIESASAVRRWKAALNSSSSIDFELSTSIDWKTCGGGEAGGMGLRGGAEARGVGAWDAREVPRGSVAASLVAGDIARTSAKRSPEPSPLWMSFGSPRRARTASFSRHARTASAWVSLPSPFLSIIWKIWRQRAASAAGSSRLVGDDGFTTRWPPASAAHPPPPPLPPFGFETTPAAATAAAAAAAAILLLLDRLRLVGEPVEGGGEFGVVNLVRVVAVHAVEDRLEALLELVGLQPLGHPHHLAHLAVLLHRLVQLGLRELAVLRGVDHLEERSALRGLLGVERQAVDLRRAVPVERGDLVGLRHQLVERRAELVVVDRVGAVGVHRLEDGQELLLADALRDGRRQPEAADDRVVLHRLVQLGLRELAVLVLVDRGERLLAPLVQLVLTREGRRRRRRRRRRHGPRRRRRRRRAERRDRGGRGRDGARHRRRRRRGRRLADRRRRRDGRPRERRDLRRAHARRRRDRRPRIELTDVTADGLRSDGCAGCCCCSELMYELCRPRPEEEADVVGREMDDTGCYGRGRGGDGRPRDRRHGRRRRALRRVLGYGFIAGCAASRARGRPRRHANRTMPTARVETDVASAADLAAVSTRPSAAAQQHRQRFMAASSATPGAGWSHRAVRPRRSCSNS